MKVSKSSVPNLLNEIDFKKREIGKEEGGFHSLLVSFSGGYCFIDFPFTYFPVMFPFISYIFKFHSEPSFHSPTYLLPSSGSENVP